MFLPFCENFVLVSDFLMNCLLLEEHTVLIHVKLWNILTIVM